MGLDNQICYGIDNERDLSEETIRIIYSNVHVNYNILECRV